MPSSIGRSACSHMRPVVYARTSRGSVRAASRSAITPTDAQSSIPAGARRAAHAVKTHVGGEAVDARPVEPATRLLAHLFREKPALVVYDQTVGLVGPVLQALEGVDETLLEANADSVHAA